ncbi:MAG: hypothetical protein KGL39_25060 [Patescibacteria group bacterium]|nr:hypothetical protein [Patescibacteria group bacterium]
MASLRGSQQLWNSAGAIAANVNGVLSSAVVDGSAVTQNSASGWAVVGPGPNVAIYIDASQTGTFAVEVAVTPTYAGLNALDTSQADGGVIWYKYNSAASLSVTGGTPISFDLSPFSPGILRLVRTDAGTTGTVTAWVTSFGPN